MKNIAILVSGPGSAAERVVRLFNEGNRVHTSVVVADDSAFPLLERLKDEDVKLIHIPDGEWLQCAPEVAEAIKEAGVKLIVLDGFTGVLTDELMEAVEGEILRVTSADLAPREVVNALENKTEISKSDLSADIEAKDSDEADSKEEGDSVRKPEEEWADTLKINFKLPPIPPRQNPEEINEDIQEKSQPSDEDYQSGYDFPSGQNDLNDASPINQPYQRPPRMPADERRHHEPMPSTWLIWSILVTVFCCFIPGIVAIIFSSQVSSRYFAGDYEGAKRASYNAEVWIIVSVVAGVLAATLYLPFMLLGV